MFIKSKNRTPWGVSVGWGSVKKFEYVMRSAAKHLDISFKTNTLRFRFAQDDRLGRFFHSF